jgi:hypothetical protein
VLILTTVKKYAKKYKKQRINKKAPEISSDALMVERPEKSPPVIIEEIARWHDLRWEDYQDYQQKKARQKKPVVP